MIANDNESLSATEPPAGTLDLRLATDISSYEKGGTKSDPARFNIDMGDGSKVYKFRATSAAEGERWIQRLNDWREYFLLHSL